MHGGKAPRWLFSRMCRLAGLMTELIVAEYGPEKMLERLSDPRWFQAFGCVLGFDWHSSGVTTTACGAVKEGIRGREVDLGFFAAGGKGAASRKTPEEILRQADAAALPVDATSLVRASRLAAKVDNTALQDGYQLYHHAFFFTRSGAWSVVQQGMNEAARYARRYHWHSPTMPGFVNEPHSGIAAQQKASRVLNMVASESASARDAVVDLLAQGPASVARELALVQRLDLPARHWIAPEDIRPRGFDRVLISAYEQAPRSFEDVLEVRGLGPKALRALVMVAELVYGTAPSWRDPAVYSFAHGGKDGIPYPVDRPLYDGTVALLKRAIQQSGMGRSEKLAAVRRLASFWPEGV
ncbi:MAG: hypothetical protein KatS3mg024_1338 [Armatimonadota bacterium]|nr:MAG: hypothetical protein KatS3mg024_1338 [Armatimonadota bacterium]